MGYSQSKINEDQIINSIKEQSEIIKKVMLNDNINLHQKIHDLSKENESLKKLLQAKTLTNSLIESRIDDNFHKTKSVISREAVEKFVDKMLQNPNINNSLIPDQLERQVYINVFCILLGTIEEITDVASIDIVGHKIKLTLEN